MDYAIIAAGEGSRLVEEGVTTPKPLVRLLGEPMIDRLMGLFLRHGATSISVIVNEEMTDVQHHMEQLALPVPLNLVVRSTPSSTVGLACMSIPWGIIRRIFSDELRLPGI